MRRLALGMALAATACTNPGTDPDSVEAIRFEGSPYPSIVIGDSLRDSLGAILKLKAVGLNYRGEEVPGAPFVFSSPDTNLRLTADGGVFARSRKVSNTPARVFATSGSLQSVPDSLFTAPRADSIRATAEADTLDRASVSTDEASFMVFGDTVALAPKAPVPGWLVSFRLRYRDVLLPPTDTSIAFTVRTARIPSIVDTTDDGGRAGRRYILKAPRSPEDTLFVIATIRQRKAGTDSISAQMRIIFRPNAPAATRSPR